MIQNTKRLSEYRYLIPLYGDIPLFINLFKSEGWIRLYQALVKSDSASFLTTATKLFGFFITVYAFPVRVFLRYRLGIYSTGWFLTAFTALTIIFYNWPERRFIWTPIYTVWFPIREWIYWAFDFKGKSWWPDMIMMVRSLKLFWFCLAFCLVSSIHTLVSYFTVKGDERDIRRGIPILWKLASRFINGLQDKDRLFLWWLLESAIVAGIGAYFYYGNHDIVFGKFLLYAASCHFALEAYEGIWLSRIVSR